MKILHIDSSPMLKHSSSRKLSQALVEALCQRIDALMKAVDVVPRLSANGVTKEAFDAAVDKLASLAYDDQCTPANPRQPYIAELKQLLIDMF